jgi:hypothetical protein
MRPSTSATSGLRPLLLGSLLLFSACKSEPTSPSAAKAPAPAAHSAEISDEHTAAALVVAVAPEQRILTLEREDGTRFDVRAGEAVRNLDQIAAGDAVRVHYKASLLAERVPGADLAKPAEAGVIAARAKQGAAPGAGVGLSISVPVRIESIDREREIVVFAPASGELFAHRIMTPQGRDFLRGLQVGDAVRVTYGEVLALTVEKLKL